MFSVDIIAPDNINAKNAIKLVKNEAKSAHIILKQDEYKGTSHNVVLELPGETEETMLLTVEKLGQLTPVLDGIKIHNLQILSGTKISEDFTNNPWHVMTLEEYSELLKKALALLNPATIIHRITGDGPKKLLIEPKWSSNKKMVLNHMKKLFPEMEK